MFITICLIGVSHSIKKTMSKRNTFILLKYIVFRLFKYTFFYCFVIIRKVILTIFIRLNNI